MKYFLKKVYAKGTQNVKVVFDWKSATDIDTVQGMLVAAGLKSFAEMKSLELQLHERWFNQAMSDNRTLKQEKRSLQADVLTFEGRLRRVTLDHGKTLKVLEEVVNVSS